MNEKDSLALEKVKKYSFFAAGAGFIPVPIADWAAISALQLKLVSDIAKVYDVPFSSSRVSAVLGPLVGGWAGTAARSPATHRYAGTKEALTSSVAGVYTGGMWIRPRAGASGTLSRAVRSSARA